MGGLCLDCYLWCLGLWFGFIFLGVWGLFFWCGFMLRVVFFVDLF